MATIVTKQPSEMDQMEPKLYRNKRTTLMVLCAISLVVSIIYFVMTSYSLVKFLKNVHKNSSPEFKVYYDRDSIIFWIINILVPCLVDIVIQLIGLFGVWRERFCITCFYTVLQILATIVLVFSALFNPIYWPFTVINLFECIVVILFVIDLRAVLNARAIYKSDI